MSCRFARGMGFCVGMFFLMVTGRVFGAAEVVVSAGPREPAEEKKAFHLPAGFEAQLVASEPEISKPLNIAFDERGRLWITDTIEYPFPAPEDRKPRDTVKILEDFGPDGHARKITTYADGLNIPIGILPQGGGAIIHSIPHVWRLSDSKNSGHAERTILLGGEIGHRDTHGMTGSFTEGFDGWIYACHGFSNDSVVSGSDGSEIKMNSGNTYRFRPDGSHVEYFTHGQVNPFGLALDPLGDLYSSDCETKPVYLLMRGGYYPSFGKPDDGLGFAPEMCDHLYGSTAIAGLVHYAADAFPKAWRDTLLVGNVMTNRINACSLSPRGSWFHADDKPDLLASDDAWFRPVNMKLGPDGALYVADFYNRIIGHYEVDLHHPGRDKQRGRLWRIVYRGAGGATSAEKHFDLTKLSIPQVVEQLASPNLTARLLAMNYLADRIGREAIAPVQQAMTKANNPVVRVHGMWVLHRLGALSLDELKASAADNDRAVRVHAMRVLADISSWDGSHRALALAGLNDADAIVVRVATDALGRHPAMENMRPLLDLRQRVPATDTHLLYTVRMALRDQLLQKEVGGQLASLRLSDRDEAALADVAAGAATPEAAAFLLHYVEKANPDRETMARGLRHAAQFVTDAQIDELAKTASTKFASDFDLQLALFKSVQEGVAQRGGQLGEGARKWGAQLAAKLLETPDENFAGWVNHPVPGKNSRNPWVSQMRPSADGNTAPFITSFPLGESLTGVLRSKTFALPEKLRFFLAGQNGMPSENLPPHNVIRLHLADGGETIAEAIVPRNDVAQPITWDLSKHAGKQGYIEATDGNDAASWAWIAFGRFDPPIVKIPPAGGDSLRQRLQNGVDIVAALKLADLGPQVEKVLTSKTVDLEARGAAARALVALNAEAHAPALASVLGDFGAPEVLRDAVANALAQANSPAITAAMVETMRTAPQRLQLALAKSLASSASGGDALLNSINEGKASPRLLQDKNVKERLAVSKPGEWESRVAKLTQGLPAADAELQKLIDERAATFDPHKASPARGAEVFTKNCAACHRIQNQGNQIGPQLDGIGVRGAARLSEDILDPSRNVDAAFRYSTFVLKDGDAIAGLPRREEGETIIVADSTGKEVRIDKAKVKKRVQSNLSLMPSNFGELLKPDEFNDLLSYLLTK